MIKYCYYKMFLTKMWKWMSIWAYYYNLNMEHFLDQQVKETTKMRLLSLNLRQIEQ